MESFHLNLGTWDSMLDDGGLRSLTCVFSKA